MFSNLRNQHRNSMR